MNLSVNGQSKVPPGFRFHPTEEELLQYYLKKKVASEKIDLDVIRDIDLNKLEPWDIQEKCRIGSTPQNDWYFFSHKDKKYPTGSRTNRATAAGFWKATGRDKVIYSNLRRIGMRKTLVFYKGRAPHGQKSDWIMHEYRLEDSSSTHQHPSASTRKSHMGEEGWVVCRVFKKRHYQKVIESPRGLSASSTDAQPHLLNQSSKEVLHQILSCMHMGKTNSKWQHDQILHHHHDPTTATSTGSYNNMISSTENNAFSFFSNSLDETLLMHNSFEICDHDLQLMLNNSPAVDDPQYDLLPPLTNSSPPLNYDHEYDDHIDFCYDHHQSMDEIICGSCSSNRDIKSSIDDHGNPSPSSRFTSNECVTLDGPVASQLIKGPSGPDSSCGDATTYTHHLL